jgi:hypothetical protein
MLAKELHGLRGLVSSVLLDNIHLRTIIQVYVNHVWLVNTKQLRDRLLVMRVRGQYEISIVTLLLHSFLFCERQIYLYQLYVLSI